jgi:preprotein translocase subunit SecD
MAKKRTVLAGLIVVMMASVLNGQIPLEIRAASSKATSGWAEMKAPGGSAVWVAPTSQLTAADVARAELRTPDAGPPAVAVVFTADGAKKMRAFSTAQLSQPIAILLDGRLVWAPIVRSAIGAEAVLTGGPGGLSDREIKRLLAAFNVK